MIETQEHEWYPAEKKPVSVDVRGPYHDPQVVETLEGDFEVDEQYIEEHNGFYIIRGVEDEVYPIGVDVFEKTYKPKTKLMTVVVETVVSDSKFIIDSNESNIVLEWNRGAGHSVSFTVPQCPDWVGEPVEATVKTERIDDIDDVVIEGRSRVSEIDDGVITIEISE